MTTEPVSAVAQARQKLYGPRYVYCYHRGLNQARSLVQAAAADPQDPAINCPRRHFTIFRRRVDVGWRLQN